MTDETKTLTEDEQFAQLIEGNPLFDHNGPDDKQGNDRTPTETQASAGAVDEPGEPDEPQAVGDAGAGGEADQDQGDAGAGAEPDTQGQPQDAAQDAPTDEPFPGYSALSEEARAAFDKIASDKAKAENDYRALHGMTAPLQRGNAELRRQHDALLARIQQLEQVERKQQDVSAAKDRVTKEFDDWAEQFPEESKAIAALVNPLREKVVALEGSLQAAQAELGNLHTERQQAALAREVEVLEKAHPDWRAIHESPQYWDWLNHQPPGIQGLNSSMFAGDTVQLLNLFKSSLPKPEPKPEPAAPAGTEAADAVRQRRNQSLARGTQPNVRTTESSIRGNQAADMSDEDAQYASLVADNPLFQ